MFVVGLTGGIGSGKSAAAKCFADLGIPIVDADLAAREVVRPRSRALQTIFAHFGSKLAQENGSLDRAALRQIVFADPRSRKWLEQLLHPLIHRQLKKWLKAASGPYVVLVSPLLLESGQRQMTQRVVVVDVPEELQEARAMARDGCSRELVRSIMASQMDRRQRLREADEVLDNSTSLVALRQQVQRLDRRYRKLAATQPGNQPGN